MGVIVFAGFVDARNLVSPVVTKIPVASPFEFLAGRWRLAAPACPA
jgi:hypothetical protein